MPLLVHVKEVIYIQRKYFLLKISIVDYIFNIFSFSSKMFLFIMPIVRWNIKFYSIYFFYSKDPFEVHIPYRRKVQGGKWRKGGTYYLLSQIFYSQKSSMSRTNQLFGWKSIYSQESNENPSGSLDRADTSQLGPWKLRWGLIGSWQDS